HWHPPPRLRSQLLSLLGGPSLLRVRVPAPYAPPPAEQRADDLRQAASAWEVEEPSRRAAGQVTWLWTWLPSLGPPRIVNRHDFPCASSSGWEGCRRKA